MRAACEDHEEAIGFAHDPDAIGNQVALVNAQAEIRGKTDIEDGIGFVERAGEEKAEEHQEVDAEISPNERPDNSAATGVDGLGRSLRFRRLGCDRSRRYRRRCGLTRLPFRNFCHRPVCCCYRKRKSMSRECPYQMLPINTGLYDLAMAVSRVSRRIFSVCILVSARLRVGSAAAMVHPLRKARRGRRENRRLRVAGSVELNWAVQRRHQRQQQRRPPQRQKQAAATNSTPRSTAKSRRDAGGTKPTATAGRFDGAELGGAKATPTATSKTPASTAKAGGRYPSIRHCRISG